MDSNELALEIANLAAGYLIDGAAETFQSAKEKAARALGTDASKNLPTNIDLQRALAENLALLEGDKWRERVQQMRLAAIKAMHFFADFEPHLVGSVLYGTATKFSVVCIHVYSDDLESVIWRLNDAGVKFRLNEISLRVQRHETLAFPSLEIAMSHFDFDIVVFPLRYRFNPPNSPLDGKTYQRADAERLQRLIDEQRILNGKYFESTTELGV
ncbi:MAG: hypothetical protein ACU84Q_16315 [Gammaproteobacteria bacterium]